MFKNKEELVNWLKTKDLYKEDVTIKEYYNVDNLIESFTLRYSNTLFLTFYYESVYSFEYRLAL